MSPSETSLVEEEGTNVDGVDRDGVKREGGAVEFDCRVDTVVASMAHMIEKWLEEGKGTEKWHKIRVIAEGKMSLSWVAISLNTSKIERIKCEGKSIVRCSRRESKNRA